MFNSKLGQKVADALVFVVENLGALAVLAYIAAVVFGAVQIAREYVGSSVSQPPESRERNELEDLIEVDGVVDLTGFDPTGAILEIALFYYGEPTDENLEHVRNGITEAAAMFDLELVGITSIVQYRQLDQVVWMQMSKAVCTPDFMECQTLNTYTYHVATNMQLFLVNEENLENG